MVTSLGGGFRALGLPMAENSQQERWWLHQWHDRRHPITVYYGDHLVAEYEGRFKLVRAWLRCLGRKPKSSPRAERCGSTG